MYKRLTNILTYTSVFKKNIVCLLIIIFYTEYTVDCLHLSVLSTLYISVRISDLCIHACIGEGVNYKQIKINPSRKGLFFGQEVSISTYPLTYNTWKYFDELGVPYLVRLHNKILGLWLCTSIFTERDEKKCARRKTTLHTIPPTSSCILITNAVTESDSV